MKLRNRTAIRIIARLLTWGLRLLYATCRVQRVQMMPRIMPYAPTDEEYVYCVWHDGITNAIFSGPTDNIAALTSRHADGEYVAELLQAVGMKPIRGSASEGGAQAMKQLLGAVSRTHVVITPDGPRGPRRTIKPGILFLASHSGRKIVPVGASAKNCWRPRGRWTDLLVPRPFTDVYTLAGLPMTVPPGLRREDLRPLCDELQRRMDEIQEYADQLARGEAELTEWTDIARRRVA